METDPLAFIKRYPYIFSIIVLGVLVYANSLFGNPVWDDLAYVFQNPQLHSLNLIALWGKNVFNNSIYYRPIPAIYFALLSILFGQQTFPFHFIQVSMHIANVLLLFIFLKKFFKEPLAFCLSLIFLVHPLTVESVAYIAAADNTLFFLLGISTMILTTRAHDAVRTYVVFFLLFLSLLLIKESGIMFIFFSLAYGLLYKRRSVLPLVFTAGLSITSYFLMRFLIVGEKIDSLVIVPIAALPLSQRVFSIPKIFYYYIQTFFFPKTLAIEQYWVVKEMTLRDFYFPLAFDLLFIFFIGIIGYVIFAKYKQSLQKAYLFFLWWFFVGIGIHLQIFPLDMTVAERWFYSPMIGLLGILGVGWVIIWERIQKKRKFVYGVLYIFVGVLLALSVRTLVRNTNWYDSLTLYQHDAQLTDSWSLENNLGTEFFQLHDYPHALLHMKKSVALLPLDNTVFNLGSVYEVMGNKTLARAYYYSALKRPGYVASEHSHYLGVYINVIQFAVLRDDFQKASPFISQGLSDYPNDPDIWKLSAIAQYRSGNYQKAAKAIKRTYQLSPTASNSEIRTHILHHEAFRVHDTYLNTDVTIQPGQ